MKNKVINILIIVVCLLPFSVNIFSQANYSVARDVGSQTIFDVVISLYNDPTGDNDPNNNTGSEEQTAYENIVRFWADAIYEQTNGAHELGTVRIFRNGEYANRADVVWNAREWPRANISGFTHNGHRITFGDVAPFTSGDYNMLDPGNQEEAGYTLGHEWGHYVYALFDEYRGTADPLTGNIWEPWNTDNPIDQAIMNNQWNATTSGFEWLNHSTSDGYSGGEQTAQWRCYNASCWDVLVRDVSADPKPPDLNGVLVRVHYTTLDTVAPSDPNWIVLELPGEQANARDNLDIIWMEDDTEMQIVIDRSGSMRGSKIANAKNAAQTLVDVVPEGSTALGVVSYSYWYNISQNYPITSIPVPGTAVKDAMKARIAGLSAGGLTAMLDAAGRALTNLNTYRTNNNTQANRMVFLLTDGHENNSRYESGGSITSRYTNDDVPLLVFGYGSNVRAGYLTNLAEGTGGRYYSSPTALNDIQDAFLNATTAFTSQVSMVNSQEELEPGNTIISKEIVVDATIESFSIVVNYTGSASAVTLSLLDSMGVDTGVVFNKQQVGSETSCNVLIEKAVMTNWTGTWTLEANTGGADIPINVKVIGTPEEVATYDMTLESKTGNTITYPQPIIVTATVGKDNFITGVNIQAEWTDPSGNVTVINMNDNGIDGDNIAEDGIYSAIIDYQANGTHELNVVIDNEDGNAYYTNRGYVGSPDPEGYQYDPAPGAAIPENFIRTSVIQLIVQGYVTDDHANTAPGTSINADNTDNPGQIDYAQDIDFFSISNIDLSNDLVVRVTELAMGMDPVLTIYGPDGTTVIAEEDLSTGLGVNDYINILIPVSELQSPLYASVRHIDDTAATGIYHISAGISLVSEWTDYVELLNSYGNGISGADAYYYDSSKKEYILIGTTNNSGRAAYQLSPGSYKFKIYYMGKSEYIYQDTSVEPVVTFNTIKATIQLENDQGTGIPGAIVKYYNSIDKSYPVLGTTDASGEVECEMLANTYVFSVSLLNKSEFVCQDISINPVITVVAKTVTFKVSDSNGPVPGIEVSYLKDNAYTVLGITGANGELEYEMLDAKYIFCVDYSGEKKIVKQDISANQIVIFKL